MGAGEHIYIYTYTQHIYLQPTSQLLVIGSDFCFYMQSPGFCFTFGGHSGTVADKTFHTHLESFVAYQTD